MNQNSLCKTCGKTKLNSKKGTAYTQKCRTCWANKNALTTGSCYILSFPGTGICKVGHTRNLERRIRHYTSDTRIVWSQDAPLDACRRAESRIKKDTVNIKCNTPPWDFAANIHRTRRGRQAFSGESELRTVPQEADISNLCAQYASILDSEITKNETWCE